MLHNIILLMCYSSKAHILALTDVDKLSS